jgi:hypothetical protein
MTCPYCNDIGLISRDVTMKDRYGNVMPKQESLPCICVINPSIDQKYKLLSGLPEVVPEDIKRTVKEFTFQNYRVYGVQTEAFLYALKCFIACPLYFNKSFLITDGYNMVKNFHTADSEGKSLENILDYDLLVLVISKTDPPMAPSKDVVYRVIYRRVLMKKPVWIFSNDEATFQNCKEYTEVLDDLLTKNNFLTKTMDGIKFKNIISTGDIKTLGVKNRFDKNAALGNI